ncbi:uncharacterized protein LTHEOB_7376 [Lasiodiplodia theobromae]|uniref:uncharacterized protein n=1 Tax=Lasiodiplodia theobromae TaxID=45133 RepID=UPI0015C3F267|nr:uncharacterized protein LTHEOB_7376 [Lasiodiplodia theobromae]KAF4542646.1 hypothetical protein LTHEOB_7376 [Lasiodiplodia theobromae]
MALLLNHLVSFVSRDEMYHRGNADFTRPSHGLMAVSLWTISASVSILSSRFILIELNYHFPLHLLLVHLFVLSAILVSHRFASAIKARYQAPSWFHATVEYTGESNPDERWYHGFPTALCAAAALPLLMQAILHWVNLSTLALMPAFAYLFCDIWTMITTKHYSLWIKFLEVILQSACCAVILYDEYRLTPQGIFCTLMAMLFTGLAMGFSKMSHMSPSDTFSRRKSPSLITTIAISFFITFVWCVKKEETLMAAEHILDVDPMVLGLNVGSTVAAVLFGNSFIVPISVEDHFSPDVSRSRVLIAQVSASFGFTAIVGFASSYLTMRSYATVLQAGAFCLAVVCIINAPRPVDNQDRTMFRTSLYDLERFQPGLVSLDSEPLDDGDSSPEQGLLGEAHSTDRLDYERWMRKFETPSVLSIAAYSVIILTWIGFLACNFAGVSSSDISEPIPQLDLAYEPVHGFDVVISMYKEPIESVTSIMEGLSAIPAIAESSPRLFLYTKDEDLEPSTIAELGNATNAFKVIKLPNVGREGETYLEHILLNWDSLAKHTLFVQADVHNPREFFNRVQDYYSPNTGMLSLGFSGKTCDTANCGDRWSWYEGSSLLNDVCRRVDGEDCKNILLSYKGQFITSAARIRAVERELYEDLKSAMTDPDSWAHKEPWLNGRPDSLNAPRFGYTMERLWSVVMQCSTEEVAWRCPTLLSRTRRGGDLTDCQCMDPKNDARLGLNSTVPT